MRVGEQGDCTGDKDQERGELWDCLVGKTKAGPDETPSTIAANNEKIEKVRQRLSKEELQIVDLRGDDQSGESISSIVG